MPAESRDARVALAEQFDSLPGLDQKWKQLLLDAFESTKTREVSVAITCKCCGKERKYLIPVTLPNWSDRAKAIDMLLTQAKGKPAETKTIDLNVTAARTREELAAMTDEELAVMAAHEERKELTDGKQGVTSDAGRSAAPRRAPRVRGSAGKDRRPAGGEGRQPRKR